MTQSCTHSGTIIRLGSNCHCLRTTADPLASGSQKSMLGHPIPEESASRTDDASLSVRSPGTERQETLSLEKELSS